MNRFASVSICLVVLLASLASAQGPNPGNVPFATQVRGPYDSLDLSTSNILLSVPLKTKNDKIPFSFALYGNSYMYTIPDPNNRNIPQWYARLSLYGSFTGNDNLHVSTTSSNRIITCNGKNDTESYNYAIVDASGASHSVGGNIKVDTLGCDPLPVTGVTWDGSGYTLQITSTANNIWDRSGRLFNEFTGVVTDPDGASATYNQRASYYSDSMNIQVMKPVLGAGNGQPDTYTYTGGDGNADGATVSYTTYHGLTVFGCGGKTEINTPIYLPSAVNISGSGTIQFTYETTPGYSGKKDSSGLSYVTGRIQSITYPSGGSVTYGYFGANNGIDCSTLVVPRLTRSVYDSYSKTTNQWTYVNNQHTGSFNFTVVETDPGGNQTIHQFTGEFQTWTQYFQGGCPTTTTGCNGGGTELRYVTTCYNGNVNSGLSGCQTASPSTMYFPITQTDVYTWVGMAPQALTETIYDCKTVSPCYGLVTEIKKYDYGASVPPSGTPLSDTVIAYSSGSTCGSLNPYIYDRPCSITVTSPSGQVSQTKYTYNAGGHPVQTQRWVSGSIFLTSSATYGTNGAAAGVLSSETDVNGATTSYSNFTCNNMLPTTINYPLSLSATLSWDSGCQGAVVISSTDVNTNTTFIAHNDPLWRQTSTTDPLGLVTYTTYSSAGALPETIETSRNFPTSSPTSTDDTLYTLDGLGRVAKKQNRVSPGATTFDGAVLGTYGWNSTGPFKGQTIPGGTAVTTTQLDALARSTSVTDGGGGSLSITYPQNDVVSTLGPPPSGESSKQVQNQYDGLGRLTSSCEISSTVSGNALCNQNANTSFKGVLTTITYNGETTQITRGGQQRTTIVDGLGRVTSSTTPEGGTITYTYDYWSGTPCAGTYTFPGKLVLKRFASGNFECYDYDSLGRLTDISAGYSGGGTTACDRFRYDNSTGVLGTLPSGVTPANFNSRIVEAETDNCVQPVTSSSIITDEWFSYDKDGRVTDMWEKTPHSGIYYHSVATFAGNGVPLTVHLANPSLYTETYGLDGEGRLNTLISGTETIVSGTSYNAASQPTYVDIGTGTDQSRYIYDPNTGRMTNWTFQVGSTQSETGGLTWNPNGTLKSLTIVDGFNAAGSQTCNYNSSLAAGTGYDDLGRLVGVNCGSAWAQTFSYDQYDNLTRSGSISWNPGYNAANNHYSIGSYDNSGNLTGDSIHLYKWNQFNKLSAVDSTSCTTNGECITYDAFGRMVETSYNGAYTELWYTQLGKVYMIGSGPYYAYWPAPGNGTAEVNGNAVTAYYMHKDWLGSARISQTIISHTVESDQAYAPFGEVYNKLTTGAGVPAQMFTGDTQDVIGGIFDTPNRDLNASQGRWLSPDPAGAAWNQYAYVNSNPLSNIDPSGLACYPLEKNVFGTCAGFMNNGVSFGQSWTELYIFTAALSGSYEAIDPSKKSIPMSVSNGQIAIGGCDGAPDCEDFEVPQLMTVYPNIRLLGMLSAITISVTALDPAALNPSLSSQAYMLALHSAFNKFPDLCNPGVGATGKLGPLAANLNVNQNGVQGTVSGEAGPLSVEGAHDMSINVGDGVGGTLGFDPMKGTIKNVGAFTGFKASGMELTVNVHADVVAMGSCPSK